MKNFFERQDQARTKTRWLVILFILAVFLTGLAVHALVSLFVSAAHTSDAEMELNGLLYWTTFSDPTLLFWDFLIVSIVIGGGSLFKTSQLSSTGGDGVAKMLGGKPVNRTTTNPQERQLLNIVEEMAIASGIRVPNVYILRDEPHINAFAAGFTPATSVVAVTQGALDYLNRDELQGVIGHEFSHILHGDTNINLRLIGALFGLSMLVILGVIIIRNAFYISWSSSSNRDGNKSALAIMLCC
ncbi:MAG: M48 family metalloprotease, partial [Thermoguttaceae bacterium]|nr:M48 family metalloprotease [Thermoguttaceae bacterium]